MRSIDTPRERKLSTVGTMFRIILQVKSLTRGLALEAQKRRQTDLLSSLEIASFPKIDRAITYVDLTVKVSVGQSAQMRVSTLQNLEIGT